MERSIDLSRIWQRVWAKRRGVIVLVTIATLATGVVAFLLPPWYTAETALLPPSEEESGVGLAQLLRGVGVPGVSLSAQATPADVFIAVLRSRTVNEEIVRRFDLKRVYDLEFTDQTLKELGSHVDMNLTAAGTISIAVEDRDRQRAADMANAYVEVLDRFNRETRMTKGRRTRLFLEARLADTKRHLERAEQTLADFQSKNKAAALRPEVSTAVETAARLYAQRSALEVRLGVVRSYTRGPSEEATQIEQQMAELDRQLAQLPTTGLELARLVREVRTYEQVYILLTAQYEEARINEVRDITTVEILDRAVPPERKSRPRRLLMVAGAFALSSIAGVAWALTRREPKAEPSMRVVASS